MYKCISLVDKHFKDEANKIDASIINGWNKLKKQFTESNNPSENQKSSDFILVLDDENDDSKDENDDSKDKKDRDTTKSLQVKTVAGMFEFLFFLKTTFV